MNNEKESIAAKRRALTAVLRANEPVPLTICEPIEEEKQEKPQPMDPFVSQFHLAFLGNTILQIIHYQVDIVKIRDIQFLQHIIRRTIYGKQ